jgi:hypothetical protein
LPKLFFPKALRPTIKERFWTVPSHKSCNESYNPDEMGQILLADVRKRMKNEQTAEMVKWLLGEMKSETPGGLILPPSIRRFSVNQVRIQNVALKVTQCIYFREHGKFLPKLPCKHCELVEKVPELQEWYRYMLEHVKPFSIAKDVFNYRYVCVDGIHHFVFMFWAGFTFCVAYDDPEGRKDFTYMKPQ